MSLAIYISCPIVDISSILTYNPEKKSLPKRSKRMTYTPTETEKNPEKKSLPRRSKRMTYTPTETESSETESLSESEDGIDNFLFVFYRSDQIKIFSFCASVEIKREIHFWFNKIS